MGSAFTVKLSDMSRNGAGPGSSEMSPAECIYIGDAERDVLAARAAGMRVYVAMFGYIPAQERPREWPATGWLEGPEAVAQLLDALPPRN
jgi:phosphoglycolate phosphatase-like HAD superfamily hydrolase